MGTRLNVHAPMSNDQMIKRHHFCYGCQQSCSTAARNAGQVKRKAALATIPIRLVGGRIEPTLADLAQESAVFPSFRVRALKDDDHSYTVNRYVERNALRASLVERAEG
jgi:hypothetical protein